MSEPGPDGDRAELSLLGPGGPRAVELGCCCSVLANAAFRTGCSSQRALIDPTCRLHALAPGELDDR